MERISAVDLAAELGVRKQTVFKAMKRLEIEPSHEVTPNSRGQRTAVLEPNDAELVASEIDRTTSTGGASDYAEGSGYFYLLQLEPDLDPGRFKVGFAANPDERLRQHRTAAPLAEVVGTWPSRSRWERTAIDFVADGCERVGVEVFRAGDVGEIEERCQTFFGLMPEPSASHPDPIE